MRPSAGSWAKWCTHYLDPGLAMRDTAHRKMSSTSVRTGKIVVVIDGNCSTSRKKRAEIQKPTRPRFLDRLVAGCPNPPVERWFLADPDSFHKVVGYRPVVGREKCEREHYKRLLADAIRKGSQPATLGGIEFAAELVEAMNLYRAGRSDSSLRAFVGDLRSRFREVRGSAE